MEAAVLSTIFGISEAVGIKLENSLSYELKIAGSLKSCRINVVLTQYLKENGWHCVEYAVIIGLKTLDQHRSTVSNYVGPF